MNSALPSEGLVAGLNPVGGSFFLNYILLMVSQKDFKVFLNIDVACF